MPILGISDLWNIFDRVYTHSSGSKKERRDRAEKWLDSVYHDLEELSSIWIQLLTFEGDDRRRMARAFDILVEPDPELPTGGDEKSRMMRELYSWKQTIVSTRLSQFYRYASRISGMDGPFQTEFLSRIAHTLIARTEARTALDARNSAVTPEENERLLVDMRRAAHEMHTQLAALQASITTFKAQPRD